METDVKTITSLKEHSGESSQRCVGLAAIYAENGIVPPPTAIHRCCSIGRLAREDIVIADSRVSRHHASVTPDTGGIWVTDAGSHNGTFLNGERVGDKPVFAAAESVIRIGNTLLLVVDDVDTFRQEPRRAQGEMCGGPRTARMQQQLGQIATSTESVLLEGETGTGKELAARWIHAVSGRQGAFVAINCAALPADLVESELFGHVRGAFSGSQSSRQGMFRTAHRGTLLLDEVGDLPASGQAKLLRVLEECTVRPVGRDESIPVDVRLLSATNRPLSQMLEQSRFRVDLFHRIASIQIRLAPLRERREDIPLLAAEYLGEPLTFSAGAMEKLVLAHWAGNVRELRNAVRMIARSASGKPLVLAGDVTVDVENSCVLAEEDSERDRICAALKRHRGNVVKVAHDLGLGRGALYNAFGRLHIDPARYRKG